MLLLNNVFHERFINKKSIYILIGGHMVDLICKHCGAIYEGNQVPDAIQCICESTEFDIRHAGITDVRLEEAEA